MLDHIEDLRKLTNENVNEIVTIFKKGFPTANESLYNRAFQSALLIDIAQSLRDLNKKLNER